MLNFLSRFFAHKTIDLEAKLYPVSGCQYGGYGEIEIESFSDGKSKIELSLKHSSIPSGNKIDFYTNGEYLASVEVINGYAKSHEAVPLTKQLEAITAGAVAEIRINGNLLYQGTFRRD